MAFQSEPPSRRIVRVSVPEHFVLDAYINQASKLPQFVGVPCLTGVPDGAKIVRVMHDPLALCFGFIVQHDSFPEVPCGELAPEHPGSLMLEFYRLASGFVEPDAPTLVEG
jgi:hypothetical protein